MKNFLISILILFIIILLGIGYYKPSIFFGDNIKEKKQESENQYDSKRVSALMSTLDFYSSSNIISLLSIKYSMSTDVLIEILSECNNQTQLDYDLDSFKLTEIKNKMKNDAINLNTKLADIANKYNITSTTLVSIIIDYKLLKNSGK